MTVQVTFLGGLGEVGRNCSVLEDDGRLAMIDCGLMFPTEDMPGVDLVFPDWEWVVQRHEDLELVVLTHGHEDHVGALGYFLRDVNVPVYGTPFSIELARARVSEVGVEADLRVVSDDQWVSHGSFRFQLIPVSHSVPQGCGVAFETSQGIVVHSGDLKLDPTPIDDRPTDLPTFAALGAEGIRLLMADSTNAEQPGFVPSERTVGPELLTIFESAPGRVIAACFSSHLHRVQQIIDVAIQTGRYISLVGRSMERNVSIGTELGLVDLPSDRVLPIEELLALPEEEALLISTGSQGEPFAALSLMAAGRHRWVTLGPDDTVIISATPIPGNETAVSKVISGLMRSGARVFHGRNAHVHVSGHARQDELRTFINVLRPRTFVPIHGEYRHLRTHGEIAEEMLVPEVIVCENGDTITLDGDGTLVERDAVAAGYVYLDGTMLGDVRTAVIRDRAHLADEGVVVVTVGFDLRTGDCVHGPNLDSHGLMDDPEPVLAKAAEAVELELRGAVSGGADPVEVRRIIRQAAARVIKAETGLRPVVLPVVLEV
ncbi:MAG: ribonuclease J [Acidimicrobiia bacterium]